MNGLEIQHSEIPHSHTPQIATYLDSASKDGKKPVVSLDILNSFTRIRSNPWVFETMVEEFTFVALNRFKNATSLIKKIRINQFPS